MRKILYFVLSVMCIFLLCACNNNTESMPQANETTSSTIIVSPFIGEWNANVVVGNSDAGKEYAIYTITLNSDGKATYRDKVGTWAYYEEQQKISLTFPEGIVGLTVSEENGKTILKYFQDTYYRAEEFVEFN